MKRAVLMCLALLSCETKTGQGAFIGAAGGAVIGGVAGGGTGALIGAGAGAVGGALIGAALDESDKQKLDPDTRRSYEAGEPLTVNAIIRMHEAGIEDKKIIQSLKGNKCYPVTSDDLEKLKGAGVSQDVIKSMRENRIQTDE